MDQPTITSYTISDFLQWQASGQLEIAPRFQRRSVWSPKARSYLIDTVIREMPIPPVFIRMTMDLDRKLALREVVDGQQRLRAILEFIHGEFPILAAHNEDFGGYTFAQFPGDLQAKFLSYLLPIYVLENITDSDVLNIFARLNTYTFPLNEQELRNAEFFGALKQAVYEIAYRHYAFWRSNKILSDENIARMLDAELVSELVVTMIAGFQATKDRELRRYYVRYDDEFKQGRKASLEFERVLDAIGFVFEGRISATRFKSVPMFFSLFCLFYDMLYGLPNSQHPRIRITSRKDAESAYTELKKLSDVVRSKNPPKSLEPFVDASRRATADAGRRRTRHKFLWAAIARALPKKVAASTDAADPGN